MSRYNPWARENRTLNNPKTKLSASNVIEAIGNLMGVNNTASKVVVDGESALGTSAVYAAINLLSQTVGQLPLQLFERTATGRKPATSHPLYNLVNNNPNDVSTSMVWRETMQGHVLGWGNGYSFISRGIDSGRPLALENLLPDKTQAERNRETGKLQYVTEINGIKYLINPEDILHVPAMGFDGLMGRSPISVHAETIGLSIAATKFGGEFFGNGASLGGVLEIEKGLSDDARINLKTSWDSLKGKGYQGVAVLEEGLKYSRIGIQPNDAQFLETRQFQVSEIARIFNVPPHMLRDLSKSSFSNISEQGIEFLRYSIAPWLIKWEQELNRKLLTPAQLKKYYFKFNFNGLLRGTQKDRYASYGTAIKDGWLSRNEARELEDLDTMPELDGFLLPLNMGIAGEDPEPEEEPEEPEEKDTDALEPVAKRAAEALSVWFNAITDKSNEDPATLAAKFADGIDGALTRHAAPYLESRELITGEDLSQAMDNLKGWFAEQEPFTPINPDNVKEALTL